MARTSRTSFQHIQTDAAANNAARAPQEAVYETADGEFGGMGGSNGGGNGRNSVGGSGGGNDGGGNGDGGGDNGGSDGVGGERGLYTWRGEGGGGQVACLQGGHGSCSPNSFSSSQHKRARLSMTMREMFSWLASARPVLTMSSS